MQTPTPGEINVLHQKLVDELTQRGYITSPGVEAAFRAVPRHLFLPGVPLEEVYRDQAIATKSLNGQFVSSSSQPAIMAIMLEQLQPAPGQHVLEIGAGTGYNAALLAHIVGQSDQVVTIDIDEDIVEGARAHLIEAGFPNVQVIHADGAAGYLAAAPYDRVILTVNASDIAPAWHEQLKAGGQLLLPLSLRGPQVSVVFEQVQDHLVSTSLKACGFVNLRGSLAEQNTYFQPGPQPGELSLHLGEPGSIDAEEIYRWLLGEHYEEPTPIQIMAHELFYGLGFWLALHDPAICNLQARGSMTQRGIVPAVFYAPSQIPIHSTFGLLNDRALCVLMRDPAVPLPVDDISDVLPFRLYIRCFGDDKTLVNRLLELISSWQQAGRPMENNLSIRAYPRAHAYNAAAHESVVTKRWMQFVCTWE